MSKNFYIYLDQHDTNIFCDEIYDSDQCEFISEDYLKNNYFDDDDDEDENEGEDEIYDVNKCFISYLDDQIDVLLNIDLLDKKFNIDLDCKKIIESKKYISENYEKNIDRLFDDLYGIKNLKDPFIKNLCLNDINKNKVIDYLAIFDYASDLYIRDLYTARKCVRKHLSSDSLFELSKRR